MQLTKVFLVKKRAGHGTGWLDEFGVEFSVCLLGEKGKSETSLANVRSPGTRVEHS